MVQVHLDVGRICDHKVIALVSQVRHHAAPLVVRVVRVISGIAVGGDVEDKAGAVRVGVLFIDGDGGGRHADVVQAVQLLRDQDGEVVCLQELAGLGF